MCLCVFLCVNSYIHKYKLLSLFNVTYMHVFRTEHSELDNLLVCALNENKKEAMNLKKNKERDVGGRKEEGEMV